MHKAMMPRLGGLSPASGDKKWATLVSTQVCIFLVKQVSFLDFQKVVSTGEKLGKQKKLHLARELFDNLNNLKEDVYVT